MIINKFDLPFHPFSMIARLRQRRAQDGPPLAQKFFARSRIGKRSSMSVYCLVHGSTQSPRGWELLVSQLRARGHECICVDLPTDEPDASATRYAEVVGAALAGVNKATVVAHSA